MRSCPAVKIREAESREVLYNSLFFQSFKLLYRVFITFQHYYTLFIKEYEINKASQLIK